MIRIGLLAAAFMGSVLCAPAATISWWRFEDGEDTNPSVSGMTNPNEVAGQPSMVSSNAVIVTDAPSLFAPYIPQFGIPNTGSVRSYINGAGTDGIFGSAAYSSVLDVNTITVEFWVRTTEFEAGFVARTTNAAQSGETGSIDNGFRIVEPENLRVDYWVSNNSGSNTTQVTLTSGIAINDGQWHYIAFRYNATNGLGELILDGAVVASNDGTNNRRMYWGDEDAEPGVHVGYRLDGNPNNTTGTLDEIRFSDTFLNNNQLLVVPEPSTVAAGLLLVALAAWDARRRLLRRRA